MTHNLLGKAALFTGTVGLAAIITSGPATAQLPPQPDGRSADVGISTQSARVRGELTDIASDRAGLPVPAAQGPSAGTYGDLPVLGGAGGLLVAAAVGVALTRRHKGAAPRTA